MRIIRQYIMAGCILTLPGIAAAQQDSSLQAHTEAFRWQYNRYAMEALTQPLLKQQNYSLVQAGYRAEKGEYRQAQAPQQLNDIFFYTEGSRQIKKILVSGSFGWQNIRTDSTAFALRNNYKEPNPYFYYSQKAGNWQTIRYQLQGIASTPLIEDKLIIGVGAKYNSFNSWRSNDPRPEEFEYNLQANVTAHYKITPLHTIGISGGYLRKNNDISWEYRNEDNQHVPEMEVFIHNAYGGVQPIQHLLSGKMTNNSTGFSTEGIYEGELGIGLITISGKYQRTTTDIFKKAVERYERREEYGDYKHEIMAGSASLYKATGSNILQLQFNYQNDLGEDYNIDLAGRNYVYAARLVRLQGLVSKLNEKGKIKYELGLSAAFNTETRKDGSVDQQAEYHIGEAALNGAYYFYFPSRQSMLKTALRAAYSHPFQAEARTVKQEFSFTKGVVYRDYYFFNANTTSIGANLTYQFPVMKTNAFIQVAGNLINADIADPKEGLIPYSYPGNNRVQWQCSIGVNL